MKFLLRLLLLPFISVVIIVAVFYKVTKSLILFLLFGGEFIIYHNKNETKTIQDIYNLLEEQYKKQEK